VCLRELTRTRPRLVFVVETTLWPARAAWPVCVCSKKMPAASVARAAAAIGQSGLGATLERCFVCMVSYLSFLVGFWV
jgi:hypothetical protein